MTNPPIYICVCVCVCVNEGFVGRANLFENRYMFLKLIIQFNINHFVCTKINSFKYYKRLNISIRPTVRTLIGQSEPEGYGNER